MPLLNIKDREEIIHALRGYCPRCRKAPVYRSLFSLSMNKKCPHCDLDFSKHDNADGPAFFIITLITFTIVPAALIVELQMEPPIWVHIVLWTGLTALLSVLLLKPLNCLFLRQQYKHRPASLEESSSS